MNRAAACHRRVVLLVNHAAQLQREDLPDDLAQQLRGRAVEGLRLGHRVDFHEVPVAVQNEIGVGDAGQNCFQSVLGHRHLDDLTLQLRLRLFQVVHVHERDDHALDAVVAGPIGRDAADEPEAGIGQDLRGPRRQRGQHLAGIGDQRLVLELADHVADGPADIGLDETQAAR